VTRDRLRSAGEAILREETGADVVSRLCPRCGSSEHGRPLVRGAHISLSYAGELVAVAWSPAGPVGIDIELGGGSDRLAWTVMEATAKASGEGIAAFPGALPGRSGLPVQSLALPPGYVGTVVGRGVSWRLAGPAAPPPAATS
jgi:hypothetical protein